MPEIANAAAAADTGVETPVVILTPQDATAEHIARGLSPEQAKAFRANRREKKAKAAAAVAAAPAKPVAEAKPDAEPQRAGVPALPSTEAEVIHFDAPEETPAATADESPAEISEDELAKLDEKARKRITDASKEAAKVRKRAQEAEAKLKEHETKVTELETKLAELSKQDGDAAVRAAGLAGNAFVHFKDGHAVATWGENAKDALALLSYHDKEVKAGRRDADEAITHTLPDGSEIELRRTDLPTYQQRVTDAQHWFAHDAKVAKVRESATKLAEKHTATKGYTEARDTYLKDASLPTRLEELVAKAALYDVLQSRRAVITFPDTAGAATKAPSSKEDSTQRKDPPSESRASTPRLASVNDSGSDLMARKSLLMEKARTAKTEDERQKFLKEAIKLGPMPRSMARA
jgi:hypothetical protein